MSHLGNYPQDPGNEVGLMGMGMGIHTPPPFEILDPPLSVLPFLSSKVKQKPQMID